MAVSRNFCREKVKVEERVSASEVLLGHMGEIPDEFDETQPLMDPSRRRYWAQVVHDALGRLSDRERDVIVLRLLEGRDTAETADTLGISEPGVRSILLRAMNRLRRMKGLREALPEWIGAV